MMKLPRLLGLAFGLGLLAAGYGWAGDWPTYRHDNRRSGVTADPLAFPLAEQWHLRLVHAPAAAWEAPRDTPVEGILELGRIQFDDTYQPVIAGDTVYLATSADHRVLAIDAVTGAVRWQQFAGGPVRLAPVVWEGKVYVTADDGMAYCFDAATGAVRWQRLLAPRNEMVLGNGRMISRWPCRTGLLITDGVGYAGVGIWPGEGVYLEAFDPSTGKTLWRNEELGEVTDTYISPQGYLLAAGDLLFVPQGRVSPAAFSRTTGKQLYNQRFGKNVGGTWALLAGDELYTGTEEIMAYSTKTRGRFAWFNGRQLVVTADSHYTADGKLLSAVRADRYGKPSLEQFRLRDVRTSQLQERSVAQRAARTAKDKAKTEAEKLAALDQELAALAAAAPERAAKQAQRDRQQAAAAAASKASEVADANLAVAVANLEKTESQRDTAAQGMADATGWHVPCAAAEALIVVGDTLVAGGVDEVVAVRASDGSQVWTAKVQGKAKGLAASNGRLIVSTDQGLVYTFAGTGEPRGEQRETTAAFPATPATEEVATWLATQAELGQRPGFALVLGLTDGHLLAGLAKATNMTIYGVDPDPAKVDRVRRSLAAAGLYGERVCVNAAPLAATGFADYFADLVTTESGSQELAIEEAWRVTKPGNGVLLVPSSVSAQGREFGRIEGHGGWLKARRPLLPGAGSWSHQYADAGNTACGDDSFLKCPLRVLWYGQPGPLGMVSRHQRAASPLAVNGVLFVQCEDWVEAYDAYNGVRLWRREFPKVVRTVVSHDCGNLAADGDSFYVVYRNACYRLASHTGETLATFPVPAELGDGQWGWVARQDGLLLGSVRSGGRSANAIFAYDVASGKVAWTCRVRNVLHPSLSAGDGRIFLVDDSVDVEERREALQKRLRGLEPAYAEKILKDAPVRTAMALDAKTGQPVWQRPLDLTGGVGGLYWSSLGTMYRDGVVVVFGIYSDGHYWQDFFAGQFESRRIVALNARDGGDLWEKEIGYRVRPLIIGDTLHAEPWAYDLHTGVQRLRQNPVTGAEEPWQFARPGHHCGCPVGSVNALFFRSYYIGYYDLINDGGTVHFSSQRPGCWVNFIPGNGLLSVPEASSGCMCPFANLSTVVFEPSGEDRAWTKFSLDGATTPVRDLCLNLGGPGDRKDADGKLWLGYPRPGGSLVLPLKVEIAQYAGGGSFRSGLDYSPVDGSKDPWLYVSGYRGLRRVAVPVMAAGEGSAAYTVRLHFAEMEDSVPVERTFGIRIQGQDVATDFAPAVAAGGPRRAVVREFAGIEATEGIQVELVAANDRPSVEQAPILQGIEIVRERVLRVGLAAGQAPLLNRRHPAGTATIRICNHKDEPFVGTLRCQSPAGMQVAPASQEVKAMPGEPLEIELKLTADPAVLARGTLQIPVVLQRGDGGEEAAVALAVEYLGDRDRMVVSAAEDTFVGASFGGNKGTAGSMLVDGGDRAMGDFSHHIAYLRFRLDQVPGKLAAAQLRLYNAGNPSSDGGSIHVVTDDWDPARLTYQNRPASGAQVGDLKAVASREVVDVPLDLAFTGQREIRLVIEPDNCDGIDYLTRESNAPAELRLEYTTE